MPMPSETVVLTESNVEEIVRHAAEILRNGGVIVYPTDTSYGIGCDPRIPEALDRLIEIKRRNPDLGVPLLFANLNQCKQYHEFTALELALTRLFWPGALTIVVSALADLPPKISGKRNSIAIRIPNHVIPRRISKAIDGPIVGTSANRSGGPSPFDVTTAREQLGDEVDLYIDGGRSQNEKNSTIIGVEAGTPANIRVYREGAVSVKQLTEALRVDIEAQQYWTMRLILPEM
ncbi:MAG: L-threonylcarbamoyladenylate synthase [Candidatus Thorarchaeota archaeon]